MNYDTIAAIHRELDRLGHVIAKAHKHNQHNQYTHHCQELFNALYAALKLDRDRYSTDTIPHHDTTQPQEHTS